MHYYTVSLRIWGTDLELAQVSKKLGLEASLTFRAGEMRAGRIVDKSMWAYEGGSEVTFKKWESLEDGLSFVVGQLLPLREQFARYQTKYEVGWWCGHFQSSFDGGPTLSPHLLRELADFGVELFIDNYFSNEDEPE